MNGKLEKQIKDILLQNTPIKVYDLTIEIKGSYELKYYQSISRACKRLHEKGEIALWNISDNNKRCRFSGREYLYAGIVPNGKKLVWQDKEYKFVDLELKKEIVSIFQISLQTGTNTIVIPDNIKNDAKELEKFLSTNKGITLYNFSDLQNYTNQLISKPKKKESIILISDFIEYLYTDRLKSYSRLHGTCLADEYKKLLSSDFSYNKFKTYLSNRNIESNISQVDYSRNLVKGIEASRINISKVNLGKRSILSLELFFDESLFIANQ